MNRWTEACLRLYTECYRSSSSSLQWKCRLVCDVCEITWAAYTRAVRTESEESRDVMRIPSKQQQQQQQRRQWFYCSERWAVPLYNLPCAGSLLSFPLSLSRFTSVNNCSAEDERIRGRNVVARWDGVGLWWGSHVSCDSVARLKKQVSAPPSCDLSPIKRYKERSTPSTKQMSYSGYR